ncbi:MAG TPA: methyltransferase domain-containing protein [Acetobacteraceae bacterium]|jgi:SAM-dependent methyltransferase|nr:methyltransferase domain-containing protein [Acetobacteraceae bacterium]
MARCTVCGGESFVHNPVLWDALIAEWQLSPHEVAYVNRQQGTACTSCGANLRIIALANAIRAAVNTSGTLREFVSMPRAQYLDVLEVNEAGNLGTILRRITGHVLARYPEVDIHALPYRNNTFDLVIHSDTLEHVANPVHALAECRRVLKPGGALCFTVPTIVGRLSRTRAGLPKSYHGFPGTARDDYVVASEFGADAWAFVIQAGFASVSIATVDYPDAIAYMAKIDG